MAYIRNISGTYMNYVGNIYEIGYMGKHQVYQRNKTASGVTSLPSVSPISSFSGIDKKATKENVRGPDAHLGRFPRMPESVGNKLCCRSLPTVFRNQRHFVFRTKYF